MVKLILNSWFKNFRGHIVKGGLSYKKAGVDIETADASKKVMAEILDNSDKRILNRVGAFATLIDAKFEGYSHPVLVFKMEEPGSKQKLAVQYGRTKGICYDLINHLVNDIIVMGAKPLAVQDAIICGKLEKKVVTEIVKDISEACKEQGCVLTGGETSEQPGVLEAGVYILAASIIGVVEKSLIVDGSKCQEGDLVLAVPSNGLHTNGYSLVRALIAENKSIVDLRVEGETFLDHILKPHTCYYQAFSAMFAKESLHGMAHITGGGIGGNLNRILPSALNALIDLSSIKVLPIFKTIRNEGNVADADMLKTFNLGVGMTLVIESKSKDEIVKHLLSHGLQAYVIGKLIPGRGEVVFEGGLSW